MLYVYSAALSPVSNRPVSGLIFTPSIFGHYILKAAEAVKLTVSQMAAHSHQAEITRAPTYTGAVKPKCYKGFAGGNTDPEGNYPGPAPTNSNIYQSSANNEMGEATVNLTCADKGTVSVGYSGSGQYHENRPPYLAVRFIICTFGDIAPRQG